MCSVLLVLLILVVTFVNLQDYSTQWYTEEEAAQTTRCSQNSLVSTSHGSSAFEQAGTSAHQEYIGKAPQSGLQFHFDNTEAHQYGFSRFISMEMLPLSTNQQEDRNQVRDVPFSLDIRDPSQDGAEATADLSGHCVSGCLAATTEIRL